mgnify:CR=1 FL=1
MSHVSTLRTRIEKAHPDVVRQAVEMLVRLRNDLEVTQQKVAEGRWVSVSGAIVLRHKTGEPIAINWKEGQLTVSGDRYVLRDAIDEITAQLEQCYVTAAFTMAAARLGYQVQEAVQDEQGNIAGLLVRAD